MTLEELQYIAASVSERRGWDFSRVRDDRDPVPWDYAEVVRRYLQPSGRVLDIGTGGGERFLALAPHFGTGVDIDADIPEDFDIEKHWRQIDQIITDYRTPRGIETNKHRELLIVRKK